MCPGACREHRGSYSIGRVAKIRVRVLGKPFRVLLPVAAAERDEHPLRRAAPRWDGPTAEQSW
jgi:hypothetical protein